jgi:hypothetical protein
MKDMLFVVGLILLVMGIGIAAPVFGFIVGCAAAVYFLYAVISDGGSS